jgi:hypothetical protein
MNNNKSKYSPIRTIDDPVYTRNIVLIMSKESYVKHIIIKILNFHDTISNIEDFLNLDEYLPPYIDINVARKTLKFPVGHPIDGEIYATSEIAPDRYVPISTFYHDMYQLKLSFFMDMCSKIGVKDCVMTEIRENGTSKSVNMNLSDSETDSEGAGSLKRDINSLIKMKGHFSFPKPKHKIDKIESKWLNTEPTWRQIIDIRINRDISIYEIEFNIEDDYGVNLNALLKFAGNKIKIGGELKEFKKASYTYKIEFWEK